MRSMYSLPSASVTRAPRPLAMKTGSAPTERHARTGEFTPPGMIAFARSKMDWLRGVDIAGEPSPESRARAAREQARVGPRGAHRRGRHHQRRGPAEALRTRE